MKRRTKLILAATALAGVLALTGWVLRSRDESSEWVGIQLSKYESYDGGASRIALLHVTNQSGFVLTMGGVHAEAKGSAGWQGVGGKGSKTLTRDWSMPSQSAALVTVHVPDQCQAWRARIEIIGPNTKWQQRRLTWARYLAARKLGWMGRLVQPRPRIVRGPELPPK